MTCKNWTVSGIITTGCALTSVFISIFFTSVQCGRRNRYAVTSIMIEPYLMINPQFVNHTGNERYTGYIADLMKELSTVVGIHYRIHEVSDKSYGTRRLDGTWDGMIGELVRGTASIAAAPLYVTKQREMAVSFTDPFLTVEATTLISQYPAKSFPKIKATQDLLRQNIIPYGTLNTGIIVHAFKNTNNTEYRQLFQNMKSFSPSVFTNSNQEGIDRVRAGGYAFVLPSTIGEYIAMQAPCDLKTVDRFLMKRHFALAVPKDSYILSDLNKGLAILRQQGTLGRLYKKWWFDKSVCSGIKSSSVVSKHTTNSSVSTALNQNAYICTLFFVSVSSLLLNVLAL